MAYGDRRAIALSLALLSAVILLFYSAMTAVDASVGVAIVPAGGKLNISMDGGRMSFYVFNSGTEKSAYKANFTGAGKDLVFFNETAFYIEPLGGYVVIEGKIEPDPSVVAGIEYPLMVTVRTLPPEGGGVGVGASVSGDFKIMFYGNRTKPYVNLPQQMYAGIKPVGKHGTIGAGTIWGIPKTDLALYSIVLAALVIALGVFIWKKRESIAAVLKKRLQKIKAKAKVKAKLKAKLRKIKAEAKAKEARARAKPKPKRKKGAIRRSRAASVAAGRRARRASPQSSRAKKKQKPQQRRAVRRRRE